MEVVGAASEAKWSLKYNRDFRLYMARRKSRSRRYPRNYKVVVANTKNVGSAGAQVLIGKITKADGQLPAGYLSGIKLSAMLQEAEQDTASIMFYLSSDDDWSDNNIITAAATSATGGSAWLKANRRIRSNATPDSANDLASTDLGPVYLWVEAGDYVATEHIRYCAEVWGYAHVFTAV